MRALVAIPLLTVLLHPAISQDLPLFDRITVEDGLPAPGILSLFEDRDGYIWIGTQNGLARHEGVRIRAYHHDRKDPGSLCNEQVNCFDQDDNGHLWVGTANGLCRFDPRTERFTHFPNTIEGEQRLLANRIIDILCLNADEVWVNTELGLFRLEPDKGRFTSIETDPDGRKGPLSIQVGAHGLTMDPQRNGIWLATLGGLAFHDLNDRSWHTARHDPNGWGCFDTSGASNTLLMPDGQVWWFDLDNYRMICCDMHGARTVMDHIDGEPMRFTPRDLQVDPDGTVWLSTWTRRFLRFIPATGRWQEIPYSTDQPGALPDPAVTSTLLDRRGTRWFGTSSGIVLLSPARQTMQTEGHGDDARITAHLALNDTLFLLGLTGGRIALYDRVAKRSRYFVAQPSFAARSGTDPLFVMRIRAIGGHKFLIASNVGVEELDIHQHVRRSVDAPLLRFLNKSHLSVNDILLDRRGNTWFATWSRGIVRIDAQGHMAHFHREAEDVKFRIPNDGVICLMEDDQGHVWAGLNDGGGLVRFPNGEGPVDTHHTTSEGTPLYGVVMTLAQGPDGHIWTGTHQGGVERLDPVSGTLISYTRSDGLPSDRVFGSHIDGNGTFWAISSNGVASMSLVSNGSAGRFTPLLPPRGLLADRFGRTASRLSSGRIVLSNQQYLLLVSPDAPHASAPGPVARIVSVRWADGALYAPASNTLLTLPHDRKQCTLELAALEFVHPQAVRFAYRIADMDTSWRDIGHSGRLDLHDLPRGRNRVEVRASLDGISWSAAPAILVADVLPPLWATWWFRSLVLLVVVLALAIGLRLYVRSRLERQRVLFEREKAIAAERMRIAGDMHDDLGAGLSALKLRSEMALRVEQDPSKREHLGSLANTAGELIGSMRQIIWTMNEDQRSVEDLVVYVGSYARQYLSEHGIAARVDTRGPWPTMELGTETRRNIFLVVKEALHNVVKHAHAGTVTLEILWLDGLHVSVSDDGLGLDHGVLHSTGNGLRNMNKRISSLGGRFNATGGSGTRITFFVPITGAHP